MSNNAAPAATTVNLTFSLSSAGARTVYLAIFFPANCTDTPLPFQVPRGDCQPKGHLMVREMVPLQEVSQGVWRCDLSRAPGRYEYLFLVDGSWVMDPDATEVCSDGAGGYNAARTVPPIDSANAVACAPAQTARRAPLRRAI
jgi:hypothetical protein